MKTRVSDKLATAKICIVILYALLVVENKEEEMRRACEDPTRN